MLTTYLKSLFLHQHQPYSDTMTFNLNVTVNVNFPKPLEVVIKGDDNAELEAMRKELDASNEKLRSAVTSSSPEATAPGK